MSQRIFHHLILLALVTAVSGQLWAKKASDNASDDNIRRTLPIDSTLPVETNLPANRTTTATGPYKAYFPSPDHIPFLLLQDIPWSGNGTEHLWEEAGDTGKPGFYIQFLKWSPSGHSSPHFHAHQRFISVLSGTWWVSYQNQFDFDKTYPLPAGTLTEDIMNTVHWDGSKASDPEPAVLEIIGFGPVPNTNVGEDGKPLPPRQSRPRPVSSTPPPPPLKETLPIDSTLDVESNLPAHRTTKETGPYKAYFPDPSHIPFILAPDIPWRGKAGHEQSWNEVGDPNKPGFYIQLLRWWPGNHSSPHFNADNRFVTVLSGTWWVSDSNHFDFDKTYPLPAGTIAEEVMNTVHWDGAKASTGPVVLEVVGFGPVPDVNVGENGKPLPPRAH